MTNYRLIDHTADFGLQIFGSDAADLFTNAATALFEVLVEVGEKEKGDALEIKVSGEDWPDLMVNWLRELLYLWSARERIVTRVDIRDISENELIAKLSCARFNPDRHEVINEIKAVTYHQIQVLCRPDQWESRVIFDV